jgi:hypothetical protein
VVPCYTLALHRLLVCGYEVFEFPDDIVIMVRGKVDSVFSERMKTGLDYATTWCEEANLGINPKKTVVISFTRRR